MSDDLSKDMLARLNRLEMFAGHVADWAGNPLLHIKARAMLEATAQDVAEPKGLIISETLPSDDIAKRMEALVRAIWNSGSLYYAKEVQHLYEEACALKVAIEPVGADLVEARKQAADNALHFLQDKGLAQEYLDGDMDDSASIRLALAAIRRGRALERDSREG